MYSVYNVKSLETIVTNAKKMETHLRKMSCEVKSESWEETRLKRQHVFYLR